MEETLQEIWENRIAAYQESASLWVKVGSARIAVRPGFEPQLLRDVVAALETLC